MEEEEYDPIVTFFMSTLGDRLQTKSRIDIVGEVTRQAAEIIFKRRPALDVRDIVSQGLFKQNSVAPLTKSITVRS